MATTSSASSNSGAGDGTFTKFMSEVSMTTNNAGRRVWLCHGNFLSEHPLRHRESHMKVFPIYNIMPSLVPDYHGPWITYSGVSGPPLN